MICASEFRFGSLISSVPSCRLQSLNLTPSFARRSILGVDISAPKQPMSLKPRSVVCMHSGLGFHREDIPQMLTIG